MTVFDVKNTTYNSLGTAFCILAVAMLLTGCGLDPWQQAPSQSAPGQAWNMPAKVNSEVLTDQQKTQSAAVSQVNTSADFQPRGLNLENYFAYDIKNPLERSRRTEHAVIALEKQVLALQDEIIRLKKTQAYMPHPSSIAPVSNATSAPQQIAPKSKMKSQVQSTPAKKAAVAADMSGPLKISQFRVGEHSDRTRLVFDATGEVKYSYDLDNSEKLLVIELQGAKWSQSGLVSLTKSSVVAGYSTHDGGEDGTTLVLQLKKASNVVKEAIIRPNDISPYYRLVIDLSK